MFIKEGFKDTFNFLNASTRALKAAHREFFNPSKIEEFPSHSGGGNTKSLKKKRSQKKKRKVFTNNNKKRKYNKQIKKTITKKKLRENCRPH